MAQAIVELIPNYVQIVADDTTGTTTIQWWNGTAWVSLQQITNSSGAQSIEGAMTLNGGGTIVSGTTLTNNGTISGGAVIGLTELTTSAPFNDNAALNSFAGTTAGTVYWAMPMQGTSYKKVAVYLSGYENDTATAQTITFPTAFADTPWLNNVVGVPGTTVSTTALSIDPNNTTTYTGWIFVEGF